jgi:D-arabinose 1-dehydrogenase-like Zn-dependent alcohol dehydrogenase
MIDFLDLAARHRLGIDIERIPLAMVNNAMDRLAKGDVKGRFVIDFALQ